MATATTTNAPLPDDLQSVASATGWQLVYRSETTSTNDDARALRDAHAPPRTVVVAHQQSAGRGRAGRRFASPPGGLYFSALLPARSQTEAPQLVALCAVALAESLAALGVPDVQIKWPNDIWIERRKVAGILLEAAEGAPLVIAGLGVNLDAVPESLDADTASGVTAVAAHAPKPVARGALLALVLQHLDRGIASLNAGDLAAIETPWQARLALVGEPVELMYRGSLVSGRLEAASLRDGLQMRTAGQAPIWCDAALAHDLRPA